MEKPSDYESNLEEIDAGLKKSLFSREFQFCLDYDDRERVIGFFNEVLHLEPLNAESKREIFFRLQENPDDEAAQNSWITCNSRMLFNVIMNITREIPSFRYLRQYRNYIIEDFDCLIIYGREYLPYYVRFFSDYDDIQMYTYLHDVVKMYIGRFYNAMGLYFNHTLRASYRHQERNFFLTNKDTFDWKNVYIEVWCVDPVKRRSAGHYLGPPVLYPVCIEIPSIEPLKTEQLPLQKTVTGDILTNELSGICLWSETPQGIGFHRVLNNSFFQKQDDNGNIPVFIEDFDRHLYGWPTSFP